MYIVLFGPPGAGKGTYGRKLSQWLGIPVVATGDMLRAAIEKGTELGERVKKYVYAGELVPDDIMREVVKQALDSDAAKDGVIFDGFPRTLQQAKMLEELLSERGAHIDLIIELNASDDVIIERLSSRRVCPKCGAVYNLRTNPPKDDNKCDVCGTPLVQRDDDKPETIKFRLDVYHRQTAPLLEYFRQQPVNYLVISTEGTIGEGEKRLREELFNLGILR
ncbi:adenylate kinase [bacterium]|nr:adenylate kinase [bacterium]